MIRKFSILAVLVFLAGCGTSSPAPDTAAIVDTLISQDLSEVDTQAPSGTECCPAGVCSAGKMCIDGACLPIPGESGCYRNVDCDPGQMCVSPTLCGCGDTDCVAGPGTCRYPEGCCNETSECGVDEVCVTGTCWPKPTEELACRINEDCGVGWVCEGETGCICDGTECQLGDGYCAVPGACCASDAECGANGRCLAEKCVPLPQDGRCDSNADCSAGNVCAGALACPCGASDCLVPTTKGQCIGPETACCTGLDDCPEGSLCVDGKACVPVPKKGGCYLDDHCGPGAFCEGASLCSSCDPECTTPAKEGICRAVGIACETTEECGAGMRCVAPDRQFCPMEETVLTKYCVEDVAEGCWQQTDCAHDQRCTGVEICTQAEGCEELNRPGECMALGEKDDCCDSHHDCADGFECRNSNTSITCPPKVTAICLPKPEYGLSCWNYMDCPESQVCIKARICACGARCFKSSRGWCEPASQQNCNADIDCGDNYSCARDLECVVNPCYSTDDCPIGGKCEPDVPGQCWTHQECGDGSYCKGLRICPADATCPEIDKPGECAPEEDKGGCCDSYFACAPGLRCISAVAKTGCDLDLSAICVPYGQFNTSCYTDDECSPNRKCMGAKLCACGLEGCDAPPTPGQCVLK